MLGPAALRPEAELLNQEQSQQVLSVLSVVYRLYRPYALSIYIIRSVIRLKQ